jgi:hypothetical protein
MKKQHVLVWESRHEGWVACFVTLSKAKRCLKMETEVFYVFHCNHTKNQPFKIKLKFPLGQYYSCLSINEYQEWEDDEEYVIITDENCDEDCLIVTHKHDKPT